MDQNQRREAITAYKMRKLSGGVYCIRNTENGRISLQYAVDLHGCENRLRFSQMTDSCTDARMREDWEKYGGSAFVFELLETLDKREEQSDQDYREDLHILFEMWDEKLRNAPRY